MTWQVVSRRNGRLCQPLFAPSHESVSPVRTVGVRLTAPGGRRVDHHPVATARLGLSGAAAHGDFHVHVADLRQFRRQSGLLIAHQDQAGRAVVGGPEILRGGQQRAHHGTRPAFPPANEFLDAALAIFTAKIEPMVARTVSTENGSTQSPPGSRPRNPPRPPSDDRPQIAGSRTACRGHPALGRGWLQRRQGRETLIEHSQHGLRIIRREIFARISRVTSITWPRAFSVAVIA